MKYKIIQDAKKQKERKRKQQSRDFAERYDKTKEFKFPDKDQINMEKHFYFPKFVINDLGTDLSNAALAVYPVICSRANFEENAWIQLPQDHIAKMAGVSVNTAAKGIRELASRTEGLLERRKITEGKRHYYIYKVGFVRKEKMQEWKGEFFIFHTCIIVSGAWAGLNPRAKALYLTMRSVAKFDPELYALIEDIPLEEGAELSDFYNVDGQYRNRKWDVCESPLTVLCRMVGIERSNIEGALKQLEQCRLVEKVVMEDMDPVFKVYLKPRIR